MGIFDIIGPVMIGPSSSHTAGAARIGKIAREILNDEPVSAEITLYGSLQPQERGTVRIRRSWRVLWAMRPTAARSVMRLLPRRNGGFPFPFRHLPGYGTSQCGGNQNEGEKWKNGDSGRAVLRRRPCHDYGN